MKNLHYLLIWLRVNEYKKIMYYFFIFIFFLISCADSTNESAYICMLNQDKSNESIIENEALKNKAQEIRQMYEKGNIKEYNFNNQLFFTSNNIDIDASKIYTYIDKNEGENAYYFYDSDIKFIVVGLDLWNRMKSVTTNNLPNIFDTFVILHELAHYHLNHKFSSHENELEADSFAGKYLAKFYPGEIGDVENIQKMFDIYSTKTHPSRKDRIEAIIIAFEQEEQNKIISKVNSPYQNFLDVYPMENIVGSEKFIMGSFDANLDPNVAPNERPQDTLRVKGFKIGKYEVSQKVWKKYMGNNRNPSNNSDCEECPVENVNLTEVQSFLNKLREVTNRSFQLPTEIQWEYTAQYKMSQKEIVEFDVEGDLDQCSWNNANSPNHTHPVGEKIPHNKYVNIYDMMGNVYEWCNEIYTQYDAISDSGGVFYVIRGGGVYNVYKDRKGYRIRHRNAQDYNKKFIGVGFRIVEIPTK